jgi:hypothetical protein
VPETETKQEYILTTLRTPIQFLKNVYVLPKVNDKMSRKEFYDKYVSWCKNENLNSKMICQNHSFYKEVEENGVEKYRTRYNGECGVHCFKVDFEALTKLFTTKKYLVESDYAEFNLEQKSKVSSFCDSDTDDDDEEDIQRQIIVLQRKLQAIKDKKKPVTVSQITWDDILADDKQQPKPQQQPQPQQQPKQQPQQPKEIKSRHITKTLSNANDVTFEEW